MFYCNTYIIKKIEFFRFNAHLFYVLKLIKKFVMRSFKKIIKTS